MVVRNLLTEIITMNKTIFAMMFAMLFATFVFSQTEEPDWQALNTHSMAYEGSTFPKEAADAVSKAVFYEKTASEHDSITVTNFVEFCDDLPNKRCFAAALYIFDPTPDAMDEIEFLVWLERVSDARFEYLKLWEYRTGYKIGTGVSSGSLSVVDPGGLPFVFPCLLVKTSEGNAFHRVKMRMVCLNRSDYPEILWEYNCDYTHESLAQAFRKSIITFKDIDNDHVNDIVLDTVEGWQSGWERGDSTFEITKHTSVFYYSDTAGKFLGIGLIPCD